MAVRKTNFLDKLGSFIPGYKGYAIRDEKRNTDKKFREELSQIIKQSESLIITHQQQLIRANEIQLSQKWDITRKDLNTIFSKIKNATYGESAFFSNDQLKENELEKIYLFDLEISEKVHSIFKAIDNEISEEITSDVVNHQVKEIHTLLIKRTNYINLFK